MRLVDLINHKLAMKKKKEVSAYNIDTVLTQNEERSINSGNSIGEVKQLSDCRDTLNEGWRKKISASKRISRGADEEME